MSLKKLPEYLMTLISAIEKIGRAQATTEANPITGFPGIFTRVAAGNVKSEDGTHKVAYGIPEAKVQEGDEHLVPLTGACEVWFLGTKGVKTLKDLTTLFTSFVAYAKANMGMNTVTAVAYVIERFNHASNISQRAPFRPDQSGATGSKAVTDIMRAGIKAGLDPAVLEQKAAAIIQSMLADQKKTA